MALIEAHVAYAITSTLPRDRIVSVLHFNHTAAALASTDYDSLASDLEAIFRGNWANAGSPPEIAVRLYNLDDPKPRAPKAVHIVNANLAPAASCPREVALCLSFFHDFNRPRDRGRIFLSPAARGLTSLGARPATSIMNDALAMATAFAGLGGIDVDWCVFSRTDNQFKKVTDAYVDDEWDTVRSRGMRPTTRVTSKPGA